MIRKPPALLAIPAVSYLLFEVWLMATKAENSLRLLLSVILVLFLLRGSRVAGIIWGLLCFIGGILIAYITATKLSAGFRLTPLLWLAAILSIGNAGYVLFSPTVRAFQQKSSTA